MDWPVGVSSRNTHTHTQTHTDGGTSEVCLQIEIKDSIFELNPPSPWLLLFQTQPLQTNPSEPRLLMSDLSFAKSCEGWCRVAGLTPRATFDYAYMCMMKGSLNSL